MSSIRPQTKNANRHTQRGMQALERSIDEGGWIGAITVAADGETFDGSARVEKIAENGMLDDAITIDIDGTKPVILRRTDIPNAADPRAVKLGIAANRVASLNLEWEPAVLAELAGEVDLSTLFYADELAELSMPSLPEAGAGGDDFDATPDDGPTRAQLGDLWIIGGAHRLIVGDCTDGAVVARLMGGERAALVFEDPPYNLASDGDLIAANAIRDSYGALKDSDWDKNFKIRPSLDTLLTVLANDASVYVCTSQFLAGDIWQWMAEWSDFYNYVVWCKSNPMPSLTMRHWTWGTELICYATRGKHTFNFPTGEHALNWWTILGQAHETEHPTEKPVEVPQRAIERSSKPDDVVLDFFLGSGTTLIAAHRTGRRCYGCEISPRYADVILRRAEAEGMTVERADG